MPGHCRVFHHDVKNIDGKAIYGHMDYGKKDPSLGWRFTDAWLSMAGTADKGFPTACLSMSGASGWLTTSARRWAPPWPGVVPPTRPQPSYALTKYVDWMKNTLPRRPPA